MWMSMTIPTASARLMGNDSKDGGMASIDAAIAIGIQKRTGENIPARK